jgi:hypothetical protein
MLAKEMRYGFVVLVVAVSIVGQGEEAGAQS